MKREVRIGLIGLGTVGQGVVKLWAQNKKVIEEKTGLRLTFKKIVDKNSAVFGKMRLSREICSLKAEDILFDPEIDLVIELIGGINPAKRYILTALEQGKAVVTANKALLAERGEEIFKLAAQKEMEIGFEASVAGAVPIISSLKNNLVASRIKSIFGVINGTCNYILTRMEEEEISFQEALEMAQKFGYAEAKPQLDIEGIDTAHKICILSTIAFGTFIPLKRIYIEGITKITLPDLKYIEELGFSLKLLAIAKERQGKLDLRVHPTLMPQSCPLAQIRGIFNGIYLKAEAVEEMMFYGLGAGSFPTASAVLSDVINLSHRLKKNFVPCRPFWGKRKVFVDIQDTTNRYYLRFTTVDRPGVLAKIAHVLGTNKISISSVIQKEKHQKNRVPIIIMTHSALEKNLRKAIQTIDRLPEVKSKTLVLRVEKDLQ